jgi:CheY-like chemotaxis protein
MAVTNSHAGRTSELRRRILIIDDDESVCGSLKNVLEPAGYLTTTAHDGQEGVTRLRAESFDLVVLDLNLPVLSGWDVLDRIRTELPSLPVVILTGELRHCERGAFASSDVVLEKPCEADLLLRTLERILTVPASPKDCGALVAASLPAPDSVKDPGSCSQFVPR